ncbi:MAG: MBL fold metallo-hydrolase [Coriobacteriia bacterium]|nr:MBL fold metallo-hydrolase [Coriobacteriia bacterium]
MSGIEVRGLALGALDTNCWLVSDGIGGPLVVIDPAGDAEELLAAIADCAVGAVVLTHGHFDHLGAASRLIAETGAPFAVSVRDAASVTDAVANGGMLFGFDDVAPEPQRLLAEGDLVEAGQVRLRVLGTPGHTPGSICLMAEAAGQTHLFSGDTLFAGSVGRTDFPGGDARAMRESIARLASLPGETLVHPGHGPDTTLAREARVNFFWPRA